MRLYIRFQQLAIASVIALTLPLQAQSLYADGEVSVTEADVLATNISVPEEARKRALSRTEVVQQQAANILVRRKLAQEARKAGVDNDSVVKALVNIATDRVLSDLWLEKLDAEATPNDAALEKAARALYVADPQRFVKQPQVKASHILIKKDQPNARESAESLLAALKQGANFEEMAKARSADPGSANRGGSLGAFGRGRMVKPFEEAVFALEAPGELSPVVETQFGFHIIRLDEKVAAGAPTAFEEVKSQLMLESKRRVISEARATLQSRLLEAAKPNEAAIEAFSAKQR